MALDGVHPVDIAAELELSQGTVTSYICQVRADRVEIEKFGPYFRPTETVGFRIPRRLHDKMRDAANGRNMGPNCLIKRLLEIIAEDDMFGAVLDDGQPVTSEGA